MEKIISFKRYICGYEEFDFSELYKGCSDGIKKLPVNVFLTEHKKFGTILINTGCSKTMRTNATSYSRLTSKRKLSFTDDDSIKARLLADKLDPVCIKKVLLTHCDPECCAGLKLLPRYEIISTAQVLSILWLADPSDGIISSTLPSAEIPRSAAGLFSGKSFLSDYFKWVFDVFGDGTVLAVDISGHAKSMAGFFQNEKNIFLAADASIDETALSGKTEPTNKLLKLQFYPKDYINVLKTLRKLKNDHPEIQFVFSHSENVPSF